MAYTQRMYGRVLSDLASQSVFAGSDETKRMDAIRSMTTKIRRIWRDTTEYDKLRDKIQHFIYHDKDSPELQAQIKLLLTASTTGRISNITDPVELTNRAGLQSRFTTLSRDMITYLDCSTPFCAQQMLT
jgi:hypothetical protein